MKRKTQNESTHQRGLREMSRREALHFGCAVGASLIGANIVHAAEEAEEAEASEKGIAEIRMKSARLQELRRFYEEILQLPVTFESDTLTVEAGTTRVVFSPTETGENEPFYHYAFNIPENKIEVAREWQKERTPLLRRGRAEVIHFSNINAHSVYFNDPAGNIVEYIARHDLNNSAQGEFGPKDMLYASEIGLVVDDVPQTENMVNDSLGLEYVRGYKSNSFTAMGDDHVRLILVKRNRNWFPNQKQAAKVHPVQATIRGARAGQLHNHDLDYNVNVVR